MIRLVGGSLAKRLQVADQFVGGQGLLAQSLEELPTLDGTVLRGVACQLLHYLNEDFFSNFVCPILYSFNHGLVLVVPFVGSSLVAHGPQDVPEYSSASD